MHKKNLQRHMSIKLDGWGVFPLSDASVYQYCIFLTLFKRGEGAGQTHFKKNNNIKKTAILVHGVIPNYPNWDL